MKKISRLFPLILCTVSVHAAPQWSCPRCTADQIKPIFERYAKGEALIKMLNTFDRNLNNGILNARGFARTCHAAGLKGSIGTEGYKKCESFVLEMSDLATPIKGSAGSSLANMSQCEADVRAELIKKEEMTPGSIVDALKKSCGFDDADSYLFKGVKVSGSQAMALAGLLGRKQCRVDQLNGILVCENKYAYIFDGLDNNNKLTTDRANNIAKGVCAVDAKTSANNRDMMSFDDSINGCPTPQVVANCQEFQKQLQKINYSLLAKEKTGYSQNYCVVSVKKQQAKSVTQIDSEDGVEIVANCKPKEIDTNVFAGSSVMPMQAIAMANRYLLKQCHKYQCGGWPEGNSVKCGDHEFRFSSINNSHQGKVSNHSISKVFCEIYGGSYTSMNDNYGVCGVPSSVCSGGLRTDVQGIVNNSIAVSYEAGQCVLSWGPRPNWANVEQSFGDGDVFDPDSWMSKPDDENNMQSVMEIQEPKNGRLADQVPVKKTAQTPAKVEAPKPAETAPKAEDKKLDVNKVAMQKEAPKPAETAPKAEDKKLDVNKDQHKKTESKEAFANSLRNKMRKNSNSELDAEADALVEKQRKYCRAAGCSYGETGYCSVEIIDGGKTSVYCNGTTKYFDDSFHEIKPADSKIQGRCGDWDENRVKNAAYSMNNDKNPYDRTMDFRRYQNYKIYKDCFEKYGYYFDDTNLEIKKK